MAARNGRFESNFLTLKREMIKDITMLDTLDIWPSTSYKSSPTWSSRPVRIQPTTLNGNTNIAFIRRRNEALFDALERRQQNLSFSSGPNSRRFMDYSV
jgi:hypothetical protein